MTIQEIIMARVPPGSVNERLMQIIAAEAEQKVRNYCNFAQEEALPAALNFTVANMAMDLIQLRPSSGSEESGPVKSVTMGDVSYSFDTTSGRTTLEKLLLNYEGDLKKYRRLKK